MKERILIALCLSSVILCSCNIKEKPIENNSDLSESDKEIIKEMQMEIEDMSDSEQNIAVNSKNAKVQKIDPFENVTVDAYGVIPRKVKLFINTEKSDCSWLIRMGSFDIKYDDSNCNTGDMVTVTLLNPEEAEKEGIFFTRTSAELPVRDGEKNNRFTEVECYHLICSWDDLSNEQKDCLIQIARENVMEKTKENYPWLIKNISWIGSVENAIKNVEFSFDPDPVSVAVYAPVDNSRYLISLNYGTCFDGYTQYSNAENQVCIGFHITAYEDGENYDKIVYYYFSNIVTEYGEMHYFTDPNYHNVFSTDIFFSEEQGIQNIKDYMGETMISSGTLDFQVIKNVNE